MNNLKKWLIGALNAALNGAATGVTTVVIAPETFNLQEGLGRLGTVVAVSAIFGLASYIQKSPIGAK